MENMKITEINMDTDLDQITNWDVEFKNDPRYDSIRHFILEDNTYYSLKELICANHEKYPIGDDERKHIFVVKDGAGKVCGFLMCVIDGLTTSYRDLFVQYIVLRPEYQKIGLGTELLGEFVNNPIPYLTKRPTRIYSYIEKTNNASINLYKKFGFTFSHCSTGYYRAEKWMPILSDDKQGIEDESNK